MGAMVPVGSGWSFAITSYDSNANEEIAEHSKNNDPPNDERQYVMVGMRASYTGEGESSPLLFGPRLKAIGTSGVEFEADRCGALPPNTLKTGLKLAPGDSIEGNVCLLVDPADLNSLVFFSEDLVDDVTQYFVVR